MQQDTKVTVDQKTTSGAPTTIPRFSGDISSSSKDALLGTFSRLPQRDKGHLLLDFTKVDYINSSGIALLI